MSPSGQGQNDGVRPFWDAHYVYLRAPSRPLKSRSFVRGVLIMKSIRWAGAAALALATVTNTSAAPAQLKAIFRTGTESSTTGLALPPLEIVNVVVQSMDKEDVRELDQCVEDQQLKPHAYQKLLRSAVVRPSPGHILYFVRGSNAYCGGLYGAHNFRYFLVDESSSSGRATVKIVFENRGDFFSIYPEISHGLNDIEASGCIVSGCSSARMAFDGRKYRAVDCSVTTFDPRGHEVKKPRRCGDDGFKDDQSSGFVPR